MTSSKPNHSVILWYRSNLNLFELKTDQGGGIWQKVSSLKVGSPGLLPTRASWDDSATSSITASLTKSHFTQSQTILWNHSSYLCNTDILLLVLGQALILSQKIAENWSSNSIPAIPSHPHITYPAYPTWHYTVLHTLVTAASTGELEEKINSSVRKKSWTGSSFCSAWRGCAANGGGGSLWTWKPRCRLGFSQSLYLLQFSPCTQNLIRLSLLYMHWHAEWLIQSWVNSIEGLVEPQLQIESVLGPAWHCRLN